jgi:coproporphyrinogen III oxidase
MLDTMTEFQSEKTRASDWFRDLRHPIVAEFHALEDRHGGAGRVEVTET